MKKLPWVLIVILSACLFFISKKNVELTNYRNTYTDTLTVHDTIPYSLPVPRDSIILRYEYIAVPTPSDTATKEVALPEVEIIATSKDPTTLSIPITQRKYETETFTAWVSGYKPQLDSCLVYPKTIVVTQTQTVYKPKRWGVGVQVGYGVCGNQLSPYIGIGISYNLFAW